MASSASSDITEEEGECIQPLLNRETSIDGFGFTTRPLIQEARLDAIQYILSTVGLFGFSMETAYLSVTYLDRVLSRRPMDGDKDWAMKLLSIACISLAAKMDGCRVPSVSEYPMEGYNFDGMFLQKMELLALNTLEWKMGFVTPFAFIPYFISMFGQNCQRKALVSRSKEIILIVLGDTKLMSYRSSVLAAAATLLALDQGLVKQTIQLKLNALPPSVHIKIADVLFCYNQLRELDNENNELPKCPIVSPALSPSQLMRSNVHDSYGLGSRRCLKFQDPNRSSDLPHEKRESEKDFGQTSS